MKIKPFTVTQKARMAHGAGIPYTDEQIVAMFVEIMKGSDAFDAALATEANAWIEHSSLTRPQKGELAAELQAYKERFK